MTQSVVLVDDDRNILISVTMVLESEGYAVRSYTDGETALRELMAVPADLVVLDIKMPGIDGFELLRRLRRASRVPVIFLTSKDGEEDELAGLQLGADDYIKKPFSHSLLVERIRTILRRELMARDGGGRGVDAALERGNLRLDEGRYECFWKGEKVALTVTEFLLLLSLASRPGMVKTRDQLIWAAYGDQIGVDDRTIDSHVKRVRRKFRDMDPQFDRIETLYGAGYRYRMDG